MASNRETSPFSALTYQEQQDRWLEWRSRQLNYQPATAPGNTYQAPMPPVPIPQPVAPAQPINPYRHAQLDQLYSRHKTAARKAVNWQVPVTK